MKTWLVFACINSAVVKILSTLRRRAPKAHEQNQRTHEQHIG
jgi:hypothetical protein